MKLQLLILFAILSIFLLLFLEVDGRKSLLQKEDREEEYSSKLVKQSAINLEADSHGEMVKNLPTLDLEDPGDEEGGSSRGEDDVPGDDEGESGEGVPEDDGGESGEGDYEDDEGESGDQGGPEDDGGDQDDGGEPGEGVPGDQDQGEFGGDDAGGEVADDDGDKDDDNNGAVAHKIGN